MENDVAAIKQERIPLRFQSLNRKWKEVVYALSGFGANLMMVLMTARFASAVLPTDFVGNAAYNAILSLGEGADAQLINLVFPVLFTILFTISKAFDGLIDIPFAKLTDSFKSRWGRRRPLIALCLIPMIGAYIACWFPPFAVLDAQNAIIEGAQIGNTIWIFIWSLIFFATYTMCLIAFYGSLSTVCVDEQQRNRVSNYKAMFDTVGYAIGYAVLPVVVSAIYTASNGVIRVNHIILMMTPLMLTMLIPLFMIKEGNKHEAKLREAGVEFTPLHEDEPVGLLESIKATLKSKPFMRWLLVNCCSFFGLQMFLASQVALIDTLMELNGGMWATILNTCAFAPVPLMLFLFKKLKDRRGVRFAYQSCLISFAVALLAFFFGSSFFWGDNIAPKVIFGCVGGLIGSWAIGSFFMMPYLIPSQIAATERRFTGKNNSAMYFAAQAVATSIVGAISGTAVYSSIKGIRYSDGNWIDLADGVTAPLNSIPVGIMLVPFITAIACIAGFFLCFLMPKDYDLVTLATSMGMADRLTQEERDQKPENNVNAQGVVGNTMLWFLSVGVFELFWRYNLMKDHLGNYSKSKLILWYILSLLVPPLYGYISYQILQSIEKQAQNHAIIVKKSVKVINIIFASLCLSFVSNALMQYYVNQISYAQISEHEAKVFKEA